MILWFAVPVYLAEGYVLFLILRVLAPWLEWRLSAIVDSDSDVRMRRALKAIVALEDDDDDLPGPEYWHGVAEAAGIARSGLGETDSA